jgi:hypothetical protein
MFEVEDLGDGKSRQSHAALCRAEAYFLPKALASHLQGHKTVHHN